MLSRIARHLFLLLAFSCPLVAQASPERDSSQLSASNEEAVRTAAHAAHVARQAAGGKLSNAGASSNAKTAANGLYFSGNFSYQILGSNVTIEVDRISNDSTTRTSGTLRFELWASLSRPNEEAAFTGYRVAVAATLSPLAPRAYHYDIVRNASVTEPPSGTYWMVLVLSEYDPANCSASDYYCITDSGIFNTQQTFGSAPPPPSGTVTAISTSGFQCYENYPQAAFDILQQTSPGFFQAYSSATSCASLGMPIFAGYFSVDLTVRVYAPDVVSAQILCSFGILSGCTYPNPVVPNMAIEYFHASFGHYFATASTDEINKLDARVFIGWARTGQSFKIYPLNTGGVVNVCRFFSTTFNPKSSHFYTPFATECATVKQNSNWQFEGEVFAVALPNSVGGCASGTQPLYRLYNNGQGAAPNHRYTTSVITRSTMIGQGWIPEGSGSIGVIACVPL